MKETPMTDSSRKTILVAGDATADWFHFPVEAKDSTAGVDDVSENFRYYPAMHYDAFPGGVFLLGDCIRNCTELADLDIEVITPELTRPIREFSPDDMIHSNAALKPVGKDNGKQVLRIEEPHGFYGPFDYASATQKYSADPEQADIVVVDDVGNGFRDQSDVWPKAVKNPGDAIVVHKLGFPLQKGKLWDHLNCSSNNPDDMSAAQPGRKCENYIGIISAADLRSLEGVNISESLSWERTAKEFVYQIQRNPKLKPLKHCPFLVIHFGTDGAILYNRRAVDRSTLIFDTQSNEGQFQQDIDGTVFGLTSVLTATIVSELAQSGVDGLKQGIIDGLARARQFLVAGYLLENDKLSLPDPKRLKKENVEKDLFKKLKTDNYTACTIPKADDLQDPDPGFWRILDQKTKNTGQDIACEIIKSGKSQGLAGVPVGCFGVLNTIDRKEIESYNAIRELIEEFLINPKPPRPLCFAVFGPPGSGKSFGVKQVIKSINAGGQKIEVRTFNISQFHDYDDLVASFHQIRNIQLEGKVPFIFFDEFDSPCGDQLLGWLKFFLAPMQDGEFKDGNAVHPIGSKAIFAFAGGTRSSFLEFEKNLPANENKDENKDKNKDENKAREAKKRFREAKGPDFVSRLRGFINVMGPNPQFAGDDAAIIRRAMVLHVLLKLNPKTDSMFDAEKKVINIDEGVLRALLHIEKYLHGTRSMEALLDMSQLTGRKRFNLSALPHDDQLKLHVDAKEFRFLATKERFQTMMSPTDFKEGIDAILKRDPCIRERPLTEEIGRRIHEQYKRLRELKGESVPEYDQLTPEKMKSNYDAAEDIPTKLCKIEYGIRRIPQGQKAITPDITDDDILKMAEYEHDRWMQEQSTQGFTYAPGKKDLTRKTNPSMVPFEDLDADIKMYDIEAVIAIPAVLSELGFEIFRREEVDIIDANMIDLLARTIHADYVKNREAKGDTVESNPSMVAFDELSDEMKESNIDNARSIPRKLKKIKHGIRRLSLDAKPTITEFSPKDIENMAKMEHSRWNWFHYLRGWILAPEKKKDKKEHNCLLPWEPFFEGGECLSDDYKEYDRETVRLIPQLLEQAGFEAYQL
jgi:RyR domain/ATPase family associated with various cellular activities (AAA)